MIKNLKLLRQSKGVSQQQLADIIMVSQQSVNKYENHDSEPGIATLCKIADYFDVSVDYLVGRISLDKTGQNLEELISMGNEQQLLRKFRKLTSAQKKCILMLIDSYNEQY